MADDDQHARPFADFLRDQARAHDELSDGLHNLIAAVDDTGKPGAITFTVKVERDKDIADTFRISDTVNVKLPKHDRSKRIYYRDNAGNLSRNDPNQMEFEGLRDVSAADKPINLKDVK